MQEKAASDLALLTRVVDRYGAELVATECAVVTATITKTWPHRLKKQHRPLGQPERRLLESLDHVGESRATVTAIQPSISHADARAFHDFTARVAGHKQLRRVVIALAGDPSEARLFKRAMKRAEELGR